MTISFNNGSNGSCNSAGAKFHIDSVGHLIVTYADNTIEDLGLVVGHDGTNGTNFYPNLIGFEVPDASFEPSQPIGWSYLSLANNSSILYFKTSAPNVTPVEWNSVEFGKGEKGDPGKNFTIDSSGTELPSVTGLANGYTFYNTSDGNIYIYSASDGAWGSPLPFRGEQGLRGRFVIDEQGSIFPSITNLPIDYTFYNTTDGEIYYLEQNSVTNQYQWSEGITFRGPEGPKGEDGESIVGPAGKDIKIIINDIDTSYTNALLVVGICPAGYVVSNIEVDVKEAYQISVNDMFVRFGGSVQSDIDSTIIGKSEFFDIQNVQKYILNEVNHTASTKDEILACVFNESVNNSSTGKIHITITIAWQSPVEQIADHI